tara:strand:- start:992 stop:2155 length:1164 start_codon:yes stop_codon:yes gene_type:complete
MQKIGFFSKKRPDGKLIWFNASSIGESLSILPIIKKINSDFPKCKILVTTSTISSYKILQKRSSEQFIHQFTPLDIDFIASKFYKYWSPNLVIFVESELWPNLIFRAKKNKIPSIVVNARISKNTYQKWKIIKKSAQKLLNCFNLFLVQDKETKNMLEKFNVKNIKDVGNLKFLSQKLPINKNELLKFKKMISKRTVILLASSHNGEEKLIIPKIRKLCDTFNDLLLIIVPRHINRTSEIQKYLHSKKINYKVRSKKEIISKETFCYLADTIGEISIFYSVSKIVMIGGSYVNHGGQNPIEASHFNCALIFGPFMQNFRKVSEDLLKNQAVIKTDSSCIEKIVRDLIINPKKMQKLARNLNDFCLNEKHKANDIWNELNIVFKSHLK